MYLRLHFLLVTSLASAAVVRVEVQDQRDIGPYVRVAGKVHFAVDPSLAANRIISDIDVAPRNAAGKVEFSADLLLLRPRDPARSSGTGVAFPTRIQRAYRVDYGPDFRSKGIVAYEPPRVGNPFAMLVPQVDADGNETAGIRLPVVEAPLATHTGWNLRDPRIGAPDELFSMIGSYLPFPRTRADRERSGDPRLSLEERYPSRRHYLERLTAAARSLASHGYVLPDDIPKIVDDAARQWEEK